MMRVSIVAAIVLTWSQASAGPLSMSLTDLVAESLGIAEVEVRLKGRMAQRLKVVRWLKKPPAPLSQMALMACVSSPKELRERKHWMFDAHWQSRKLGFKGNRDLARRAFYRRWKSLPETKAALSVLDEARKRGAYRTILFYRKSCLSKGETPTGIYGVAMCGPGEKARLVPRCHHLQAASMQHWGEHPKHGSWTARLARLLRRNQ